MNELEIIRSQIAVEQAHAAEVANACAALFGAEAPPYREATALFRDACVSYLVWVLARFEERDQTLSELLASRRSSGQRRRGRERARHSPALIGPLRHQPRGARRGSRPRLRASESPARTPAGRNSSAFSTRTGPRRAALDRSARGAPGSRGPGAPFARSMRIPYSMSADGSDASAQLPAGIGSGAAPAQAMSIETDRRGSMPSCSRPGGYPLWVRQAARAHRRSPAPEPRRGARGRGRGPRAHHRARRTGRRARAAPEALAGLAGRQSGLARRARELHPRRCRPPAILMRRRDVGVGRSGVRHGGGPAAARRRLAPRATVVAAAAMAPRAARLRSFRGISSAS